MLLSKTAISPYALRSGRGGSNPFNLANGLHEWNIVNASIVGTTMDALDTGSIGGINLINPTASQLPTFSGIDGKQSALSDGVNDILQNSVVTDFRSGDTSGVMHFVFRTPASFAANNTILFSVSKSGVTTDRFIIFVDTSANIRGVVSSGGTNTLTTGGTTLTADTNYIFTVFSTGSLFKGYLGSTLQWNTSGASGVRWFGDISGNTTGVELLSREIGGALYGITNQAYACYTPYTSDANALSDRDIIANNWGITV